MYGEIFQISAHQALFNALFSDLRYAVQHSDCRKSGAKVTKKYELPIKYIRNLIFMAKKFSNISILISNIMCKMTL